MPGKQGGFGAMDEKAKRLAHQTEEDDELTSKRKSGQEKSDTQTRQAKPKSGETEKQHKHGTGEGCSCS